MPQWHIDYFELKLLQKQPGQEGHFDPPVSLKAGNKISHVKGAPPALEGKVLTTRPPGESLDNTVYILHLLKYLIFKC